MAMVDGSGTVVKTYGYDVYGKVTSSSGSAANEFDFAGQQTDPTGLQYLRARYYDPETGTFLSRDPLSSQVGWLGHPFAYGNGNPALLTDPRGLAPGLGDFGPDPTKICKGMGPWFGKICGSSVEITSNLTELTEKASRALQYAFNLVGEYLSKALDAAYDQLMSKLNDPIALLSILQTALASATIGVCSSVGGAGLAGAGACVGLAAATGLVIALKWELIKQATEDGEYSDKKIACSVVADVLSSLVPFVSGAPGRWTRLVTNQVICNAVT
jgi:RHS repeat-associated protein